MGVPTYKRRIIITARRGYVTDGFKASGFKTFYPYKEKTIIGRIIREIWFRVGLPEHHWYSKLFLNENPEIISIQDPLITRDFIKWLQGRFQKATIEFDYVNLVGMATHLKPSEIPIGVNISTYDKIDSEKYKIELRKGGEYFSSYIGKKKPIKYDVFFVGKDKRRGKYLLSLKKQIEELGLKTKFIITANGRFAIRKWYYSKEISYKKVIEYVNESKAILNLTMPGQVGATLRDYESIYNQVKLITNNSNIKTFDFYKEQNVFILGERDIKELPEFLQIPFVQIESSVLKKHLFLDYNGRKNNATN